MPHPSFCRVQADTSRNSSKANDLLTQPARPPTSGSLPGLPSNLSRGPLAAGTADSAYAHRGPGSGPVEPAAGPIHQAPPAATPSIGGQGAGAGGVSGGARRVPPRRNVSAIGSLLYNTAAAATGAAPLGLLGAGGSKILPSPSAAVQREAYRARRGSLAIMNQQHGILRSMTNFEAALPPAASTTAGTGGGGDTSSGIVGLASLASASGSNSASTQLLTSNQYSIAGGSSSGGGGLVSELPSSAASSRRHSRLVTRARSFYITAAAASAAVGGGGGGALTALGRASGGVAYGGVPGGGASEHSPTADEADLLAAVEASRRVAPRLPRAYSGRRLSERPATEGRRRSSQTMASGGAAALMLGATAGSSSGGRFRNSFHALGYSEEALRLQQQLAAAPAAGGASFGQKASSISGAAAGAGGAAAGAAAGSNPSSNQSPSSSSPFFQRLGLIRQQAEAQVVEAARLDPVTGLLEASPRLWGR